MARMLAVRPHEGALIAGRYRLEHTLARGGMGAVWVGFDERLHREVAIKFMDASLLAEPHLRVRFDREAKACAALQTPHVVQVFDHGTEGDMPFIVMELLKGESLATRVGRERTLRLGEVAAIMTQLARGLTKAHDAGIVHRDLKPANVFLAHDDDAGFVAKVLDFGVAKTTGLGEITEETASGVLVGSTPYMSPEQIRGVRELDHRTDVWALGVIVFRCLTGVRPFESGAVGELLVKICTEPIPKASSLASLPPEIDAFFERALARDPDQRFSSVRSLAEALERIAHGAVEDVASGGTPVSLSSEEALTVPSEPRAMQEIATDASLAAASIPHARRPAQHLKLLGVAALVGGVVFGGAWMFLRERASAGRPSPNVASADGVAQPPVKVSDHAPQGGLVVTGSASSDASAVLSDNPPRIAVPSSSPRIVNPRSSPVKSPSAKAPTTKATGGETPIRMY